MRTKTLLFFVFLFLFQNVFSQVDFRKETIYFLLPTRFYDGDPGNNVATEWSSYFPGNPNNGNYSGPEDVTWRGDFKGLIQKLDYIKDLGFTAIWVTPVVQNRGPLDYHGYHAWDFTKVDPRHESVGATFKDLIDAAHAKGIKVVLDIVTNHSGRYGIKSKAELKYNTDPTQPWGKDKNGNTLQDNPNWEYDGMTPNPDDGKIWSRANLAKMPAPFNQNLALYNWPSTQSFKDTSDPNWFHHWGNGFVQGWDDTDNSYNGGIAGDCPDLNTGSQTVQDYFFNAYKQYIDWGVDAFRWDTMKHMDKADVQPLIDRFLAYKPDLFIFGEVAQKRNELHSVEQLNPHWYTWRGAVGSSAPSGQSVLDFFAESTFHNIFQDGGGFKGVEAAARYDHLYADPSKLVTWLDNHDFGPNNDWNQRYGGSDENLAACMNFMFLWRGIPTVYYGTEMRFKSGAYTDIHDASGINQSINNTGRAYYGDVMDQAPNHVIYKHIRKLNAIRKAIPALQNGTWAWAGNAPGNGVGFTRKSGSSEVAVGLAKDGSASFSFSGLTNGIYKDAVTGRTINVTNGNLSFTVTSGSAGIYVLNGPGMIGDSGAGFFEACATGCDQQLKGTIAPFSGNYSGNVNVSITPTGGTAPYTIRYTTDGSEPTSSSAVYSAPFSVSTRTVVKVLITDANGKTYTDGQQYTFEVPTPKVAISPASGNYYDPVNVTITPSAGTAPYTIYYTDDNSTPTDASNVYNAPVVVSSAKTIKAIVKDANNKYSTVISADYTFDIPKPIVTASPGSKNIHNAPQLITLTADSPRNPVTIYYTTDGSTPTISSTIYTAPISANGVSGQTLTLKYIGKDSEGRFSDVKTETYTFEPIPDIKVYFKPPASWTTAPKIHFWDALPTGAANPTTWPGVDMVKSCDGWYVYTFSGVTSANVIFNNGSGGTGNQTGNLTVNATSYYDWASQSWLTNPPTLNNPCLTISPVGGTFASGTTVDVTLSAQDSNDASPKIYYTTDGSTPTTSSPYFVKNGVINIISSNTTIKAFAHNSSNASSAIKSETYTFANAGITVYFKPDTSKAGWNSVTPKVYYWNMVGGTVPAANWPGVNMTPHTNGWYKYTFPSVTSLNVIFNNGTGGVGTNQTPDINSVSADLWYDWNLGTLSTNENDLKQNKIQIYPNPVKNELFVVSNDKLSNFSIFNTAGNLLYHNKFVKNSVDVTKLTTGVYFIKIVHENGNVSIKQFIKE
jgi:glycosidase